MSTDDMPIPGANETIIGGLAAMVRFVHELTRTGPRKRSWKKIMLIALGKTFVGAFCGYMLFHLVNASGMDPKWMSVLAGAMGYAGGDYLLGMADMLLQKFFPMKPDPKEDEEDANA